jgi:hypothetical protein
VKKYFYFIRRENGTERSGKVIRWEGERLCEKVVLFHLEGKRNGAERKRVQEIRREGETPT